MKHLAFFSVQLSFCLIYAKYVFFVICNLSAFCHVIICNWNLIKFVFTISSFRLHIFCLSSFLLVSIFLLHMFAPLARNIAGADLGREVSPWASHQRAGPSRAPDGCRFYRLRCRAWWRELTPRISNTHIPSATALVKDVGSVFVWAVALLISEQPCLHNINPSTDYCWPWNLT